MIDYGIVLIKGVPNKHGLLQKIRLSAFVVVLVEIGLTCQAVIGLPYCSN